MSLLELKRGILYSKLGLKRALKLSKGRVKSLSIDTKTITSAQYDSGIISIWNLENRTKIQEISVPFKYDIIDCSTSPNNEYLIASDNSKLFLWEIKSGEICLEIDKKEVFDENVYIVRFAPDNKYIVSAGDYISLRDVKTGIKIWKKESPGGTVSALKISGDGKYIISTVGSICIWDLKSGELIREIKYNNQNNDIKQLELVNAALSNDNSIISGVTDGGLCLWSFSGELIFENLELFNKKTSDKSHNHFNMDHFVDISPDNRYIASNAFDEKSIHIMEIPNGRIINVLNHNFEVSHIKFLRDTTRLFSADFNGNLFIWEYLLDQEKYEGPKVNNIERVKYYIDQGEGGMVEFKSSLRGDRNRENINDYLEYSIIKTISGFLNSHGGILLIGVDDNGKIVGLKSDYKSLPKKKDRDGFKLYLVQKIINHIGEKFCDFWSFKFIQVEEKDICMITINKSSEPCYTTSFDKNSEKFFVRIESSTRPFKISQAVSYISNHFSR